MVHKHNKNLTDRDTASAKSLSPINEVKNECEPKISGYAAKSLYHTLIRTSQIELDSVEYWNNRCEILCEIRAAKKWPNK